MPRVRYSDPVPWTPPPGHGVGVLNPWNSQDFRLGCTDRSFLNLMPLGSFRNNDPAPYLLFNKVPILPLGSFRKAQAAVVRAPVFRRDRTRSRHPFAKGGTHQAHHRQPLPNVPANPVFGAGAGAGAGDRGGHRTPGHAPLCPRPLQASAEVGKLIPAYSLELV